MSLFFDIIGLTFIVAMCLVGAVCAVTFAVEIVDEARRSIADFRRPATEDPMVRTRRNIEIYERELGMLDADSAEGQTTA